MAREEKRKGRSGEGTGSDRDVEVQLVPTVQFLHEHITEALCDEVYKGVRRSERQRKWSLFALARFWLFVILEPPESLSQLLECTRRADPRGFLPRVAASAEAFFQKCRDFSSGFFMGLYHHFIERVFPQVPTEYCSEAQHLKGKFPEVVAIDGSRLEKTAHRLKICWSEQAAILPGCITAVYDLFRGIATQLWFDADAASSEFKRGLVAVGGLRPGALVIGDRLYGVIQFFKALSDVECFGLFRRNQTVKIKKVRLLSRTILPGATVEDWLVRAGTGKDAIQLRLIILRKGKKIYEAVTNVLDTKRLTAADIVLLYPLRWRIERLFFDLKEVLNLKKFYAANPNAVAMQVYAAAIVHTAFRIAQADIAQKIGLRAEELSPKKLFPHLAVVSMKVLQAEFYFEEMKKANPGVELRKPTWTNMPGATVSLRRIRVQKRSGDRKKNGYSEERRKWKTIVELNGGDVYA